MTYYQKDSGHKCPIKVTSKRNNNLLQGDQYQNSGFGKAIAKKLPLDFSFFLGGIT